MRVLTITGDKNFGPGHERYELQRASVDELAVVYWGRGSVWPKIPSGRFEVVTAQDPFWRGLFGWYVARCMRAAFNVQVHTDLSVYGGLRHVLMQIVLRHANSVRVVSERVRQQVLHIAPRARAVVLPVYIDVHKFSSVVRLPHRAKNILWVGRFESEKDPLAAVRIYAEVTKRVPDAALCMLGAGSLREQVARAAQGMPSVSLPGWQNPMQYLDTADVVLCTSEHESFGASMVEALASGVAVVAPDVGVAKEAGAMVVPREELPRAVVEVLQSGMHGALAISLKNREEWARAWRESLL